MKHPPDCKRTFTIDIGKTADGYIAVVKSLIEEKAMVIKATNMRMMMNEINKVVRKRASYLMRFPFTPHSPKEGKLKLLFMAILCIFFTRTTVAARRRTQFSHRL